MSRRQTRRKCRCCTKLFIPDPRNQSRQHYCSDPSCRKASKAASQRRWLSKAGNGDYFRGADQVRRVQLWRQSHPGYWKGQSRSSENTQTVGYQRTDPDQSSCNVTDRKSTRLNSSHRCTSYAVFCLKKKNKNHTKAK